METFTLIVFLMHVRGEPWSWDYREARTPGLTEEACKAAAKLMAPPHGIGRCQIDGQPDPKIVTMCVRTRAGMGVEERCIPDLSWSECTARLKELAKYGAGMDILCRLSKYPRPPQCDECQPSIGRRWAR